MLNYLLPNIPWKKFLFILKQCELLRTKVFLFLFCYYLTTTFNGFIDGFSMILLLDVVLSVKSSVINSPVQNVLSVIPIEWSVNKLYVFIVILFFLKAILAFIVTKLDGFMEAKLRQAIQERGLRRILEGSWEYLRDMRVGQRVGAITEEGTRVAQFISAIIRASYGLVTAIVLSIMAILVSVQVTTMFFVIGVPVVIAVRQLFAAQGRVAEQLVVERQGFFASVTERLTCLFQVKVGDEVTKHIEHGLAYQDNLTKLEIRFWILRAYITALNTLMPALILFAFFIWAILIKQPLSELMYYIAGVGVIGMRVINYINIATSNIGNITAFSGSINPVYDLFVIPKETNKPVIDEKIVSIKVNNVSYSYNGEHNVVENAIIDVMVGNPLLIKGPSGAGKTTLANIIAGLYKPLQGKVIYIGQSGISYDSEKFKPNIGYVTQDIYLFHGTVRDNLVFAADNVDDEFLYECLKKAGANEFVQNMGGLYATLSEAGRSLSGGEKRRIGIARSLTKRPDILILDEVTAGLDEEKKYELVKTIKTLADTMVVIIITHDIEIAMLGSENVYICSDGSV